MWSSPVFYSTLILIGDAAAPGALLDESVLLGAPSRPTRSLLGAYSELRRRFLDVFGGTKKTSKKTSIFWCLFDSILAPFFVNFHNFCNDFPLHFLVPFSMPFFTDYDAISDPHKPPKWCSRAGAVLFFKFSPYRENDQNVYKNQSKNHPKINKKFIQISIKFQSKNGSVF